MMKRIWVDVRKRLPPSNAGEVLIWKPFGMGMQGCSAVRQAYHARMDAERFIKEGYFEWVAKHGTDGGFYAKYHWAYDRIFTHWTEIHPPISWEEFVKGNY